MAVTVPARRLDGVYGGLTARERVLIVLRRWKEGKDEDEAITRLMPAAQHREYNRLMRLVSAATDDLTRYVVIVHLLVGQLDVKYHWLLSTVLWWRAERRKDRTSIEEIVEALIDGIRTGVTMRWQELQSVEIVLTEIAEELDGEDPVHPEVREMFGQTKATVTALHEAMQPYAQFELSEPEADVVEAVRALTTQR